MAINTDERLLLLELKGLVTSLISNPDENVIDKLKRTKVVLEKLAPEVVQTNSKQILGVFYYYLRPSESSKTNMKIKEGVVEALLEFLKKSKIDNVNVYRNIVGFLLSEIHDSTQHNQVKNIPEELKLVIISCAKELHVSITPEVIKLTYNKEFTMVLGTLLYICLSLIQNEKLRNLRISSMECIINLIQINCENDLEILKISSAIFKNYFPGICRTLTKVISEDEKTGHKIIQIAIKTFGKVTLLLMRDYENIGNVEKLKISKYKLLEENWFCKTDKHLYEVYIKFLKLCYHSHEKVRLEFVRISEEILRNCYYTIPKTSQKIFEALITLSEDADDLVSESAQKSLNFLENLEKTDREFHKKLFDDFEFNFFEALNEIPSIFHSLDEQKKLSQINLSCGYLRLFQKHRVSSLICNSVNLRHFMVCLLTVSTIDKLNMRLFDEYTIQDFDLTNLPNRNQWKIFKYHSDLSVIKKLEKLCKLLSRGEIIEGIVYYLLEVYETDKEFKKEATLLLNDIISECSEEHLKMELSKLLILKYLNEENFNLNISESKEMTLIEIHENVIQICLYLEGIGKMGLNIKENCQKLLLDMLYPIVEKSGSLNPLIRLEGLKCLTKISSACNYNSISDLINKNSDYFSFHVKRKLKRYNFHKNKGVLDVYGVVMKHCSIEILDSVGDIIENVIIQSVNSPKNHENQIPFFRIFEIFLKCIIRWFRIEIEFKPIKSKKQKIEELHKEKEELFDDKEFKNIKPAEQLWKEDQTSYEETQKEDYYEESKSKKETLPIQIRLTIRILKTVLNYLPNPDDDIKILTLEILKNGLEIIRDHEDELLPIVHKIWTPLQYRFKSEVKPLIFNLSFQLLVALARVAKDFIRRRTSEKVLLSILDRLNNLSNMSYLKDRGSDFRNSQNYKLQLVLLENLSRLIIDIEVSSEDTLKVFEVMKLYLCDKQPLPLQNLCINLYKSLLFYDPELTRNHLDAIRNRDEYKGNIMKIL